MVLFILIAFIIPVFEEMFANLQAELPAITKSVIQLSEFVRENVVMLLVVLLVATLLVRWLTLLKPIKRFHDHLLIRTPLVGDLVLKSQLSNFCKTMETLLSSGIPLSEAIHVAAGHVKNFKLKAVLHRGYDAVIAGGHLHQAWGKERLLPAMMAEMVAVGEETGNLALMFRKLGRFYGDEIEALVPALTSVIEPVLIVLVGALVAGILISMYLPLFEVIGQIG